jgi:DNA-binding NarL/FixJ family response regulator
VDSVELLLAAEFTVVGAVADGTALIAAAKELQPELIITDLVMEPTSGLEAAAVLLGNGEPEPLMILLTGISDPEAVAAAFEIGIRGYVSKTRLSEDLIPAIYAVLAGSRFISAELNGNHPY